MNVWDIADRDVSVGQPEVLHSRPGGRAIAIHLEPGGALGEHQVHEAAWLVVSRGLVRVVSADGDAHEVAVGGLAAFDPAERHEVRAVEDSMLLLLLSPWPGPDRDTWRDSPAEEVPEPA